MIDLQRHMESLKSPSLTKQTWFMSKAERLQKEEDNRTIKLVILFALLLYNILIRVV